MYQHHDNRHEEVRRVIPTMGETLKPFLTVALVTTVFAQFIFPRIQQSTLEATVLEERGTYMTAKNYGSIKQLQNGNLNYQLKVNAIGGQYILDVVESPHANSEYKKIAQLEALIKTGSVITVPAASLGRERIASIYTSDIVVK